MLFEGVNFTARKPIPRPSKLEHAHVLVTGAAGFIGHHFLLRLKKERISAVGIDHFGGSTEALKRHRASLSNDKVLHVDLCDAIKLKQVLSDQRITHVVNFAAQAGVSQSVLLC